MFAVSVVIPTHQRPDLVEIILNRLVEQDYPKEKFEVILVPTPKDGTEKVVEQFTERLSVSVHYVPDDPSGKDVSAKRTHGAENAQGAWLGFLDNDMQPAKDWLSNASQLFERSDIAGIEGHTLIPRMDPPTLTHKGLVRVSSPGGFQSCNIFFRKEDFFSAGGYSRDFPWYLEDTDTAWSVLELGREIIFAENVCATHPVPPAAPWRLLHEAKGCIRKPLLFVKHKENYRKRGMKILRKVHYGYLGLYLLMFLSLTPISITSLFQSLFLLCFFHLLHLMSSFAGCKSSMKEIVQTSYYTLLFSPVAFVQTLRGGRRYGCSLQEILFLLRP